MEEQAAAGTLSGSNRDGVILSESEGSHELPVPIYCTLKTAYPKIREGCKVEETDHKLACEAVSRNLY